MNNLKQLVLNLCFKDNASFANFFVGANKQLFEVLNNLPTSEEPRFVYIWGQSGAGKSHLLSALCQLFSEHNLTTAYLPLEDVQRFKPQMIEDLERFDLLCIDDVDRIAEDRIWEETIFHCFNKIERLHKKIVVTANSAPQVLQLALPDLKSRMASGLIFAVKELDDSNKIASLQLRAKLRGLELGEGVAQFLLYHYLRDTKSLFAALDKLDHAALEAQRRLTIVFVKSVLGI